MWLRNLQRPQQMCSNDARRWSRQTAKAQGTGLGTCATSLETKKHSGKSCQKAFSLRNPPKAECDSHLCPCACPDTGPTWALPGRLRGLRVVPGHCLPFKPLLAVGEGPFPAPWESGRCPWPWAISLLLEGPPLTLMGALGSTSSLSAAGVAQGLSPPTCRPDPHPLTTPSKPLLH